MCVFYSMRPFEIKHLLTKAAYQQEGQNCSSRCPGLLVSVNIVGPKLWVRTSTMRMASGVEIPQ